MSFDWVTFGFQAVNVLILLAILRHFLFRPVAGIIAERQAGEAEAMARAEAAKAEAETAAETARAEAAETGAKRAETLRAARAEAEEEKARIVEDAREEARRILEAARAEAGTEKREARARRETETRDLALAIARRLVEAQPADRAIAGYASRLAATLSEMDGEARATLLAGGEARLVAPREMSEAERAEARAALAPHGLADLPVETDPALVAGLELRTANGVLHNSIAHDLGRIAEALEADDRPRQA